VRLTLGEAVADVRASDRLTDSAVCLVAPEAGPDRALEKILANAGRLGSASKPILEVNPRHQASDGTRGPRRQRAGALRKTPRIFCSTKRGFSTVTGRPTARQFSDRLARGPRPRLRAAAGLTAACYREEPSGRPLRPEPFGSQDDYSAAVARAAGKRGGAPLVQRGVDRRFGAFQPENKSAIRPEHAERDKTAADRPLDENGGSPREISRRGGSSPRTAARAEAE